MLRYSRIYSGAFDRWPLRSVIFRTLLCFALLVACHQPPAVASQQLTRAGLPAAELLQRAVFTSNGILIGSVIRTIDSPRAASRDLELLAAEPNIALRT
jgi:hypothetical protein